MRRHVPVSRVLPAPINQTHDLRCGANAVLRVLLRHPVSQLRRVQLWLRHRGVALSGTRRRRLVWKRLLQRLRRSVSPDGTVAVSVMRLGYKTRNSTSASTISFGHTPSVRLPVLLALTSVGARVGTEGAGVAVVGP